MCNIVSLEKLFISMRYYTVGTFTLSELLEIHFNFDKIKEIINKNSENCKTLFKAEFFFFQEFIIPRLIIYYVYDT